MSDDPLEHFLRLANERAAAEAVSSSGWAVLALDAVSADDIVETWKLQPRERATIAELARDWCCEKRWAKTYFATIGLYLAFDEEREHAQTRSMAWLRKYYGTQHDARVRRRLSRAKYHARQSLTDGLSDHVEKAPSSTRTLL